jgi:hypothetical protein
MVDEDVRLDFVGVETRLERSCAFEFAGPNGFARDLGAALFRSCAVSCCIGPSHRAARVR